MRGRRVWLAALVGLLLLVVASPAHPAGPWKARLVEAGTGQPLEGVVVAAIYWRLTPGPIHPERTFHAADEAISDARGQVTIPARDTSSSNPLVRITGPEFIFFKPGYGNWRFQGYEAVRGQDIEVRERFWKERWERFRGAGVVIEMDRLRTREERSRVLALSGPGLLIPREAVPLLTRATDQEQEALAQGR